MRCSASAAVGQFVARIEAGAQGSDEVCTLRGRDLQRILREKFGQLVRLNSVYALVHRPGYSCLMPRPQYPQPDPAAQETLKKNPGRDCSGPSSALRQPNRNLARGRRTLRAARHVDTDVGRDEFASPRSSSSAVRLRELRRPRRCCHPRLATSCSQQRPRPNRLRPALSQRRRQRRCAKHS